eukprot:CAMPEP_0205908744 /NCGR_PEP_ID=MMETSP1325-20131115/3418_1 /ASSEMBLY_ACC=CAM_ASM_000708 /TAXON_ID=236786 /ORGANISM="Florenciella sp., Strain RCC1007" /LENGTH=199 /DNA_ID=CAMNT_0053274979 /DNA_START=226 /DNA_END=825 /DNA_ORIENTATION=-
MRNRNRPSPATGDLVGPWSPAVLPAILDEALQKIRHLERISECKRAPGRLALFSDNDSKPPSPGAARALPATASIPITHAALVLRPATRNADTQVAVAVAFLIIGDSGGADGGSVREGVATTIADGVVGGLRCDQMRRRRLIRKHLERILVRGVVTDIDSEYILLAIEPQGLKQPHYGLTLVPLDIWLELIHAFPLRET